MGATQQIMSAY